MSLRVYINENNKFLNLYKLHILETSNPD